MDVFFYIVHIFLCLPLPPLFFVFYSSFNLFKHSKWYERGTQGSEGFCGTRLVQQCKEVALLWYEEWSEMFDWWFSWLVGHERDGTAAAAATTTTGDKVISTEDALRQHKQWLVDFRRDMNLFTANATEHH